MERKKFFEGQKYTIYELQKAIGSSHFYLYNYYGKPDKIKRMPMDTIVKIAMLENINPIELQQMMIEYAEQIQKEN